MLTILSVFLSFFVYFKYFHAANRVFVNIPKDYEGRMIMYFNESGYPPLRRTVNGYFAYLKNGALYTSTSLADKESMYFYLELP